MVNVDPKAGHTVSGFKTKLFKTNKEHSLKEKNTRPMENHSPAKLTASGGNIPNVQREAIIHTGESPSKVQGAGGERAPSTQETRKQSHTDCCPRQGLEDVR